MSYSDFDYFWTQQEVGNQKVQVLGKKIQLLPTKKKPRFFYQNSSNEVQNQANFNYQAPNF